jgi:peptidoglycan/xylan/chitin deacetylase (PgdA/CDA1 family)
MNGNNYGCIYDQYNVDAVREVYNAGHQIGHHTWSHPYMDRLSNDQIDYEIMRLDQAFIKILGVKLNILRQVVEQISS